MEREKQENVQGTVLDKMKKEFRYLDVELQMRFLISYQAFQISHGELTGPEAGFGDYLLDTMDSIPYGQGFAFNGK